MLREGLRCSSPLCCPVAEGWLASIGLPGSRGHLEDRCCYYSATGCYQVSFNDIIALTSAKIPSGSIMEEAKIDSKASPGTPPS